MQRTRDSSQDLSQSFSRWKMENGWRSAHPARDMCRPKVCVPWEHVFTLRHGNYLCQRKRHETQKENRVQLRDYVTRWHIEVKEVQISRNAISLDPQN